MFSVFLSFFRSDLVRNQLFRLRIAVNTVCFWFTRVNKQLVSGLEMACCPSSLVSNHIYHRIDGILLASSKYGKQQLGELAGGLEPVRNGEDDSGASVRASVELHN